MVALSTGGFSRILVDLVDLPLGILLTCRLDFLVDLSVRVSADLSVDFLVDLSVRVSVDCLLVGF